MMIAGRFAEKWRDNDLFEVVVVDVVLVNLCKDDLCGVGWALVVDDPKTLDIHLGSRSLEILQDVDVLVLTNPAS